MSTEENKRLVRRYIEEVVNTGDVSRIAEFIAPDYVDSHDTSGQSSGLDGAAQHVRGVRQTYPDLRVTVDQQLAEGDWVASRITARGTHRGEWLGLRPTGKPVEITGVNLDRVVGGRIVEHGGAANLLGPLLEIGAVRVVGPGDLVTKPLATADSAGASEAEPLYGLESQEKKSPRGSWDKPPES